ncbi:MAG: DUF3857 domain-containing protein [Bacteroidota bacterium]
MKHILSVVFFLSVFNIFSQYKYPYTFGRVTNEELNMLKYEKDTTANAVVLYEHGNTKVVEGSHGYFLRTTIYRKIKILNKEGEEHATVKIYTYNDKNSSEKVKRIKAATNNLKEPRTYLIDNNIYTKTINERWKEVTFTFPNVKTGSVLEYQYDLESKFFFNFKGWKFQSDIPKIYSEFHASIPGYWQYNRRLKGFHKLTKNEAQIKTNCFEIGRSSASCEEVTYAMKDIPALIEEEDYSTTRDNYISEIKFELSKISYPDGRIKEYTTTWEETDKRLKADESIGRQLNNKSFFEKNLPSEIFKEENNISKAKEIYAYIQNHYSLNSDKKYIFKDVDVRKAYKENFGNVSEINIALINALQIAGIESNIMLVSTRNNGFPTKKHPVMTDFNYVVAYAYINNTNYILDASDKNLPFSILPYKALNGYGRVLDFDNGSFWLDIVPKINTYNRVLTNLKLSDDGNLSGTLSEVNSGYFAKFRRDKIKINTQDDYLISREEKMENIEINSYTNAELENLDKPLKEKFEVTIEAVENTGNTLYINPFIGKFNKNPFNLDQRSYPVDFGFKFNETYIGKIEIPATFKIKSIPKPVNIKLNDNSASFIAKCTKDENIITIFTKILLKKPIFNPEEYQDLKEFFNQIINTQKTLIILEKAEEN